MRTYQKKIQGAYYDAIDKIFKATGNLERKGTVFRVSDYPTLSKSVDDVLGQFNQDVSITLLNGIKSEWELSGEKHINIVTTAYKGKEIIPAIKKIIVDPREEALQSFVNSKTAGLKLSDRVWNYTNQFRSELEQTLYVGISAGQSAVSMASDMKQFLINPDKLFRKVRDADGKLILSKAARSYKPGQGVYRSSYKNALRVTRDVTNDAYRAADNARWSATPFVLGVEIKLSNNHPDHDICDSLQGLYPTSFKWTKWHVQCICFAVPKLADPNTYDEYERAVLDSTDDKFQFKDRVKDMPANFNNYVKENSGRFDNWKRKPDWLKGF